MIDLSDLGHEPWFLRFHDLMPFRVREILFVSSSYDAFILEEDGWLTERFFNQASELNLSWSPRITHVETAHKALQLLSERPFDLVMTVVVLGDMDITAFSRLVKERHPGLPVVLLIFHEADLTHLPGGTAPLSIDRVVLWTGDTRILLAAIKLIEDQRNIDHDTREGGVRVILIVEDMVRPYSKFLALLYFEIMAQSHSLLLEGLNDVHRVMQMWARPKLLLASSFEEALSHFLRHQDFVQAVISDARFPRGGAPDEEAGLAFLRLVRQKCADLPILLQSAESDLAQRAAELSAWFVRKDSPSLLGQLRGFLKEALGFGEFVFRLPDRSEVGRVKDLYEMERALHVMPASSIEYHASRNHFSIWLQARCRFALANLLRPVTIADFKDIEGVRRYLIDVLQAALVQEQEALITDFSARYSGRKSHFVRLGQGQGSMGGKGRGIAFANWIIVRHGLSRRFPGLVIRTPRTVVIGTSEFDRYLEEQEVPQDLLSNLRLAFSTFSGPVAVRSSSLLEDSRFQPFAGLYATFMLPNNAPDPSLRFAELCRAIRAVYASTFSRDARTYFASTPHSVEEEKMAVIVQELVGRRYGERFYPHLSGVAQSYNYYPAGPQRAEEGIAHVALGLGETVVSGGVALRFCPGAPAVLPQFSSARDQLRTSQSRFYALRLSSPTVDFAAGPRSSLGSYDLADAEEDGTLQALGSVYCPQDDILRDNLNLDGPRVLTFNNILRWNAIPLAPALAELLRLFRQAMGCDVEIEFAVDRVGKSGRAGPDETPCLHVLQVRPMVAQDYQGDVALPRDLLPERVLCRTGRALGHGAISGIRDVVYVSSRIVDGTQTQAVVAQVGAVNEALVAEQAPYLLIGPGRWGSADPALGIPVAWSQISGARVMVETRFGSRHIEPSQGTHFFQNITAQHIGYLTVSSKDEWLDREWLDAQPAVPHTGPAGPADDVRHVRLETPLLVLLDGFKGQATILKNS